MRFLKSKAGDTIPIGDFKTGRLEMQGSRKLQSLF